MPFQLSPGVAVVEKDFSSIVPAVSSSNGAFAGVFAWGPVLDPVTVSSENVLVQRFGLPNDSNAQSFFTAANFLSYANNLLVVRADTVAHRNAVATTSGSVISVTVPVATSGSGYANGIPPSVTFSAPQITGGITATGTATLMNNGISAIAVTTPGSGYTSTSTITITGGGGSGALATPIFNGSGALTSIRVDNPGSGYTSAPTITFNGVGGTLAVVGAATISSDKVRTVTITNAGSGYTSAPTVTYSTPSGSSTPTGTVVTFAVGGAKIKNFDDYSVNFLNGAGVYGEFAAKYPGALGNSLRFATADLANYRAVATGTVQAAQNSTTLTITSGNLLVQADPGTIVKFYSGPAVLSAGVGSPLKPTGDLLGSAIIQTVNSATSADLVASPAITSGIQSIVLEWQYANEFDGAPGTSSFVSGNAGSNDEMHIIVIDELGAWTGTKGAILEKFAFVSKASDAKKADGTNNYYRDVVNSNSKYLWWMDHPQAIATNWGTPSSATTTTYTSYNVGSVLTGGADSYTTTDAQLIAGYAQFANAELYDISLIPLGNANSTVATWVINNVAETRKDCVVFVSPKNATTGDVIIGNGSDAVDAIVTYRNELPSSSYAVLDSGYKYQYDRYNDKYRYIPLNGDVAGLCARTDYTDDPWYSPGGFNRGQVKNVVKLAVNPGRTERDNLYKNGVNPVVNFPGQGTVLFGDKTLLAKPSAFDRINVRRLFIVLEKAIAVAAKFQLFEFNDSFTRAQFKNLVEPFLRDVQGRRGVTDFRVKCDDSNNTGEVMDRNEFVADIFIKPARSINFITLTFVAARSAVSFEEIGA
jgi:phage tail sheath protein FI